MRGFLSALYSAFAYAFFLATFLYAVGFVENFVAPKTIDSGPADDARVALFVNLALLAVFGAQHSVMARPAFKRMWTKIVPKEIERSTYVLFASLALALVMACWRPLPAPVFTVDDPLKAKALLALSGLGWTLVLVSTFLISHFQLFGLSQGFSKLLRRAPEDPPFTTPMLYKFMRHPLYAGFIIAFWSTPSMTQGHLLFAAATTAYIFVGVFFEERDLVAQFGERYRRYRADVGMFLPRIRRAPRPRRQA